MPKDQPTPKQCQCNKETPHPVVEATATIIRYKDIKSMPIITKWFDVKEGWHKMPPMNERPDKTFDFVIFVNETDS